MDTCVPSPNLMNAPFAPSPHSLSIYDQERQSVFCWGSKVTHTMDCVNTTEENGLLDDNFEDSTLNTILTPEILSSMASSSSGSAFTQSDLWCPKVTSDDSSSHDQSVQPSLTGMDDILMNIDSNEFSLIDFECMPSNPPSLCHTPIPSFSETKPDSLENLTKDSLSHKSCVKELVTSSTTDMVVGQDFVQKKFPNFPPRKSEPPVGIVAPVKVTEDNKNIFNHHPVKVERNDFKIMSDDSCTLAKADMSEVQPQTVPSFNAIKMEPTSPEFTRRRGCNKRSSTEDSWEDFYEPNDSVCFTKSKRRRCDSGSSGVTSEDGDDDDNDYALHNDDDSDDDLDADLAHMKPGGCESLLGGGKKQKQYFWQYNVQAKGPKGTRLKLAVEAPADPHVLNGFEDPVFDEGNTTVAGIRHGGKARKGDGNEVTPNPHKFFKIGHQLLRLNKKINACQLGSDVPLVQRDESRKEKNKLASRACRLKKKAQHEANKIKLHGLEMEHGQINNVLRLLWPELRERAKRLQNDHYMKDEPSSENSLTNKLTGYITTNLKSMVAGNTTDYVNNVILTVEKGDLSGGLNIKTRKT